ncbi:MAG: peroxidase-related enzyme [Planctomycetes bacterium]|nr:peroxidase-related enzyme [Planctomycetota bacterium]
MAHADNLRSEVNDDALVEAIKSDYRTAELDEATRAVLDFVVKLTRTPGEMKPSDLDALRQHGLSELAIHDIVQVAAYFNYINRIADGLGVDLEPEMLPKE